jgi:hypothetical protein
MEMLGEKTYSSTASVLKGFCDEQCEVGDPRGQGFPLVGLVIPFCFFSGFTTEEITLL